MDAASPDTYTLARFPTPVGVALLVADARGRLVGLDWEEFEPRLLALFRARFGKGAALSAGTAPDDVHAALSRYFDGDVHALDAVSCAARGTPFQRAVWAALRAIPVGTTTSYGALAAVIGSPNAARAVGLANNRNPIGVVVPCHRVVGADGALTGYAGGLHRKRWLLDHEARYAPQPRLIASTARASSMSSGESLSMRALSARW
jgi:methylated-DNA-[protein]-cysteine S-methyltransferase